ncbi:MAG: HAD family phosphatase [Firmicutes bacterium]|nr:HAD family phosphatase [Bacillota bacterium]
MKVIVSDFDETFYDANFVDNINLVNKWQKSGNSFVIATGRGLHSLRNIIDNYSIKADYYICNDGAVIYDKDYNEIYRKNMDNNVSKEIFDYMLTTNYFEQVFIDNSDYVTQISTADCNCLVGIIIDRSKAQEVLNIILNKYKSVQGYLSTHCLNIIDINVDKSIAIKMIMNKNNWNDKDVYTVGDAINDKKMLEDFNGFLIGEKYNNPKLRKKESFKEVFGLINLL